VREETRLLVPTLVESHGLELDIPGCMLTSRAICFCCLDHFCMTDQFFPSIGVAADDDESPLHEIESLCMKCEQTVCGFLRVVPCFMRAFTKRASPACF
jgi:hypothetical protein